MYRSAGNVKFRMEILSTKHDLTLVTFDNGDIVKTCFGLLHSVQMVTLFWKSTILEPTIKFSLIFSVVFEFCALGLVCSRENVRNIHNLWGIVGRCSQEGAKRGTDEINNGEILN